MSETVPLPNRPNLQEPLVSAGRSSGPSTCLRSGTESTVFEMLFRTYHARLCAFAERYVGCPDTAEEVVEEVFLAIWSRGTLDDGRCGVPKRYLYVAVKHQALKVVRHRRVVDRWQLRAGRLPTIPGMSEPPAPPDHQFEVDELTRAVREVVDQLPERCRQAYVLHREQGLSQARVAEIMGTSVRTVETQLGRASKALRRSLAAWLS